MNNKERERKKVKKKKLYTIITIILIIIIILIASGYFYFFRYRVDYVDLVYIKVDIKSNCTYEEHRDWFRDARWGDNEEYIWLPHCSYIDFNGDVITVYGDYDKSTDFIVIIEYRGWGSFSGGGDDVYKKFLKSGESVSISAAYNKSNLIYSIDDNEEKISLLNSVYSSKDVINATYIITKTLPYEKDIIQNRSFQIFEEHKFEIHKNIPVSISPRYPCK